uniref:Uncharacterized protein n=1 Tax=Oryza punctata TaxID=4537 RepID=A0A0E0JI92_ORYPU
MEIQRVAVAVAETIGAAAAEALWAIAAASLGGSGGLGCSSGDDGGGGLGCGRGGSGKRLGCGDNGDDGRGLGSSGGGLGKRHLMEEGKNFVLDKQDGSDDDRFEFIHDSDDEDDDHWFCSDQELVPETEFWHCGKVEEKGGRIQDGGKVEEEGGGIQDCGETKENVSGIQDCRKVEEKGGVICVGDSMVHSHDGGIRPAARMCGQWLREKWFDRKSSHLLHEGKNIIFDT